MMKLPSLISALKVEQYAYSFLQVFGFTWGNGLTGTKRHCTVVIIRVTAKQAELNQLSPSDLLTQANLIRSNLRSWVSANFSLTQTQESYLTAMDDRFIAFAASLTGFAVENHLVVSLKVGSGDGLKLVTLSNSIVCSYSTNAFTATGHLDYTVSFN
jgi:hypothetical protein